LTQSGYGILVVGVFRVDFDDLCRRSSAYSSSSISF
jgi:hypothetical protein